MATIIDGIAISQAIRDEIRREVQGFSARHEHIPGLVVLLIGDDPASVVYVNQKKRACEAVGFTSKEIRLPAATEQSVLIAKIKELNSLPNIHGILVQMPLPKHINELAVIEAIDPLKDVDGLHPMNAGRLFAGSTCLAPCTPLGVIEIIKRIGIDVTGARALVVGRSHLVGKPLATMLMQMNATVTVAHSKTRDLQEEVCRADILCSAIGKPQFIPGSWIKEDAVVIDVGTNSVPNPDKPGSSRLVGDVEFEAASERASYITPVPGGVGPMTIAMLLANTLKARNLILKK